MVRIIVLFDNVIERGINERLKEIITKLLYVKPDVARAQPTIRTIPGVCGTFRQLWHFLTLSDCQTPPFTVQYI